MKDVYEFKGLPGVKGGNLEGIIASDIKEARANLGKYRIVTAAGPSGAINAWIDDEGKYRANYMVYKVTKAEDIFDSLDACMKWCTIYLKECNKGAH